MRTPDPVRASRPGRMRAAIAVLATLVVAGCGGGASDSGPGPTTPPTTPPPTAARPVLPSTYRATGRGAAGDVMVHLFEWRWADVATECENVLGPAGWSAVQVAPPQEHLVSPGREWWVRYQPISYSLERTRGGTRAEFADMVTRCRRAGVGVIVDAVINHMSGAQSGTGSNGTTFTKYAYPGTWTAADFRSPPCGVSNYQDAVNVQDCELVGLAELNTSLASVRERLAEYLVGLARLGVAGFRIDAAKHMQPVELDAIIGRMNAVLTGEGRALPYVFAEVIDYGGEAVKATDYFGLGHATGGASDITEFKVRGIGDKFNNRGNQRVGELAQFSQAAWGLMPSDKAVVFLENHDTARDQGIANPSYRDPARWRLATIWLLGQDYGYPSVLSGYAFDFGTQAGRDRGPPSDGSGNTLPVTCPPRLEDVVPGGWVCEHRDPAIAAMVAFRRAVAGAPTTRPWEDGANATAYSRGDRGFVLVNANLGTLSATIPTGLPAGTYCDVLTGGKVGAACAGRSVTVRPDGSVQPTLPERTALAIHLGTRL